MKPKYFHDDIYGQSYWFFVGWKSQDFLKYMSKHFDTGGLHICGQQGLTVEWQNEKKHVISVWIKEKPSDPFWMSTLAHECVHAAGMCLDRAGVRPDWKNDEAHAYLVAALMRHALKK